MAGRRGRVLVVDDSAFARKVIRELVSSAPEFEVVATARDGLEALEKVSELKPDFITLDLVMPNLDGLGVLASLPREGGPRVVVVSMAGEDSALGIAALHAGALGLVQKPTALAVERLYDLARPLLEALRAAAAARLPYLEFPAPSLAIPARMEARTKRIVVVGASTGGPRALTSLFKALPADFPVPLAAVLHLPAGYTAAFAARLDQECALEVVEASEGLLLRPGQIVVARAGMHLKLKRLGSGEFVAALDVRPLDTPHRPSVDALFESAAEACGAAVLGVVLTGMGDDGTRGARAIRAAGGEVLTETERSCVVYGMPRSVVEAGMSSGAADLSGMPGLVLSRL
ncbi:MAG: chemotaxis response regulator protein-glutamate methylesterase [Myxococcales bacterium]